MCRQPEGGLRDEAANPPYRFCDVLVEDERQVVKIKAVGHKEHNKLYIGGKGVQL